MKIPEHIGDVSTWDDDSPKGPYPPLGFIPFSECELGNGDYFGLYWEFGKEEQDPIVCEMMHDGWSMVPCFSSLDKFIEWAEANDYERGEEEIDDPDECMRLYSQGKTLLGQQQVEEAITMLTKATEAFSELSSVWFSLAGQLRRVGRKEDADRAALNAIVSNWAFERPEQGAVRMFKGIRDDSPLTDDPLVAVRSELSFAFGGQKENDEYKLLRSCIEQYEAKGDYRSAILMEQNYGFMMYGETVSFQERAGFSGSEWQSTFASKIQRYFGTSRTVG